MLTFFTIVKLVNIENSYCLHDRVLNKNFVVYLFDPIKSELFAEIARIVNYLFKNTAIFLSNSP